MQVKNVGELREALEGVPDATLLSGVGFVVDQHEASTGDGLTVSWAANDLKKGPKIHIEHG